MRKALVTGFEPFGGETTNPSWQAVCLLPDTIDDVAITKLEVPCAFGESAEKVVGAMRELEPDLVLCVGQAGGRTSVTIERVAINVADARMADNVGAAPVDEPLVDGAPDGLFSTLPVRACMQAVRDAGVPCAISNTAGTYVCNQLMYRVLDEQRNKRHQIGGFIHVPYSCEQAINEPSRPSMSLEGMAFALESIIHASLC